jgi:hypothetical protein
VLKVDFLPPAPLFKGDKFLKVPQFIGEGKGYLYCLRVSIMTFQISSNTAYTNKAEGLWGAGGFFPVSQSCNLPISQLDYGVFIIAEQVQPFQMNRKSAQHF